MKKLILIPKTDTITICLPPDWVGKTITCTMHHIDESMNVVLPMAAESPIPYKATVKAKTKKKKRRKKRAKTGAKASVSRRQSNA